jgi:hypothetical protein
VQHVVKELLPPGEQHRLAIRCDIALDEAIARTLIRDVVRARLTDERERQRDSLAERWIGRRRSVGTISSSGVSPYLRPSERKVVTKE